MYLCLKHENFIVSFIVSYIISRPLIGLNIIVIVRAEEGKTAEKEEETIRFQKKQKKAKKEREQRA